MNTSAARWQQVLNLFGYQLVWFACVSGAGSGRGWLGPLVAGLFVAVTLQFGGTARADIRALAIAVPIGFVMDSAFSATGWMHYRENWPSAWLAPAWIWALWAAFALTLNHSLAFLERRLAVAAVLGLIGGPLAYAAAARGFGAVTFGVPQPWVMVALALAWALALPVLVGMNRQAPALGPAT